MKRLSILSALLLLVAAPVLAGQTVVLKDAEAPVTFALPHAGEGNTIIRAEINQFDLESVLVQGRVYTAVSLAGRPLHLDRGYPALPTLRESILVPDDARMALRVLEAEYRDFPNVDVVPSKGNFTRNVDPALVSYEFSEFYGQDAWYPERLAGLDAPYILRDTRGVVVEINPIQYNPATHTLRVYTAVTVEVTAAGPGEVNVLDYRPPKRSIEFEKIYARHYLNYESSGYGERYTSVPEVGDMLVITYDAFHGTVQPFVDWKNQMGVPTTIVDVSTIGSTGTQLKSYIQNLYNTAGVTFIMLIGDAAQVPYYSSGGASDPSYALLAGGDYYPDAFVGRLSAENVTQVANQVTKFVEYERDPQPGGAWYHKGVGIGSEQGAGIGDDGEADWVHIDNIRNDLLAFTYTEVDRIYPNTGASASMVANAVNNGRSIINYCGHGSTTSWSTTGFSNTHVNALVNDNMLPFIISVACVNGNFASTTCFAEAWLRASNGSEPTGAVGMYASTVNQSWAPPMSAQDEVVDLLVAEEKRTYGALCFNGACQMIDDYGYSGYDEYLYWTVFGDPSLRVRTDSPAALAVSHEGFVDPSQESYVVETAPGALVGLSHDGQFLGSAFADVGGTATIFLGDLPPAGTQITLTATGFNRLTVVEPVEVGTALVPTCDVNPSSFSELLLIGNTLQRNLTVANNGEEGSVLNYTVEMINMDGGMATEPGWLDLNRLTGSVPEGETDGLILTFDASGTRPGTYHAELHFVSNAPETIVVPVTLIIVVDPTDVSETPAALVLGQNWPNPFNPKTTIHFGLPAAGHARLAVFDAGGRLLRVLLDEQLPAGGNQVTWDGRDGAGSALPSGVYFYRLDAGGERLTRSMLLLK